MLIPRALVPALALFGTLAAGLTLQILFQTQGCLGYTLDDAYIHLALAEQLGRGHYGINAGEASAPSSSILWPFLLAPFAALPGGHAVPLVINLGAGLATVVLWGRMLLQWLPKAHFAVAVALVVLLPATNVVGLAFTGMEHSLQVLAASAVLWGMARLCLDGEVPAWLVPAAVVGPLLRYESLALSLPALVCLVWVGQGRRALWGAGGLLLLLGGFSLFLYGQGLGWLPTPAAVKTPPGADGLAALAENLRLNLRDKSGILLTGALFVLVLFVMGLGAGRPRRDGEGLLEGERLLALWGAAAIGLHLLGGRFGQYYRYEVYIWSIVLLLLVCLWRHRLEGLSRGRLVACLLLFFGLFCRDYARPLFSTPQAAANIQAQQGQMHRFVTEYLKGPVAVNDLGRVAFKNDAYVLDLWGLASRRALELRRAAADRGWMDELVRRHGVRVAMLYPEWFGGVPPQWRLLGRLRLEGPVVTPAYGQVAFYAVEAAEVPKLQALLRDFAAGLPPGTAFDGEGGGKPGP